MPAGPLSGGGGGGGGADARAGGAQEQVKQCDNVAEQKRKAQERDHKVRARGACNAAFAAVGLTCAPRDPPADPGALVQVAHRLRARGGGSHPQAAHAQGQVPQAPVRAGPARGARPADISRRASSKEGSAQRLEIRVQYKAALLNASLASKEYVRVQLENTVCGTLGSCALPTAVLSTDRPRCRRSPSSSSPSSSTALCWAPTAQAWRPSWLRSSALWYADSRPLRSRLVARTLTRVVQVNETEVALAAAKRMYRAAKKKLRAHKKTAMRKSRRPAKVRSSKAGVRVAGAVT